MGLHQDSATYIQKRLIGNRQVKNCSDTHIGFPAKGKPAAMKERRMVLADVAEAAYLNSWAEGSADVLDKEGGVKTVNTVHMRHTVRTYQQGS
jgi:hypothetical protein